MNELLKNALDQLFAYAEKKDESHLHAITIQLERGLNRQDQLKNNKRSTGEEMREPIFKNVVISHDGLTKDLDKLREHQMDYALSRMGYKFAKEHARQYAKYYIYKHVTTGEQVECDQFCGTNHRSRDGFKLITEIITMELK